VCSTTGCPMTLCASSMQSASLSLPIEGMTCASCARRVEQALAGAEGGESAAVNLATARAASRAGVPLADSALVTAVAKAGYPAPADTAELAVRNMSCASCVGRVERVLRAVPGVTGVAVNLATERASVQGVASEQALLDALSRAGYPGQLLGEASAEVDAARREGERRALWRDLLTAAVLTLPVFVIEMG